MSFDTIQAKKIINSLRAHSRQPGGEIMDQAANSLQEALTDAMTAVAQVRGAEAEAIKAKGLYEDGLLEIKRLRESTALGDKAISVLHEVAGTKKGAASKAYDWLVSVGKLPPAVAPTEEAKIAARERKP